MNILPFAIILSIFIIPVTQGDNSGECKVGETWVEQKVKFECFTDDDWFGVRAVACVPSNTMGGHELMPGDVWSNQNFKYRCDRINQYDIDFNVIACLTPTTPAEEIPLNSSLPVPGRGIYKCIMRNDSVVVRKLRAGCIHEDSLHSYGSSWISDDTKMSCIWKNGSYQVQATACMTEDGFTVDVGSYTMIGTDLFRCERNDTDSTNCGLVKVDKSNNQNWQGSNEDSDEESDTGSSGTGVQNSYHNPPTTTPSINSDVEPPSSHVSHEIPESSAESPPDPFNPNEPQISTTVAPATMDSNTSPAEMPPMVIPEPPLNSPGVPEETVTIAPTQMACEKVQPEGPCKDAHPEACKLLCSSMCQPGISPFLQGLHQPVTPVMPFAAFVMPILAYPGFIPLPNTGTNSNTRIPETSDKPEVATRSKRSIDNEKVHSCKRLIDVSEHIVQTLCPQACGICGKHINRGDMAKCYVQSACQMQQKI